MSVPEFVLPEQIQFTLDKIEERGHEAYVVGGCIHDLLMGRVPNDWDVATSALLNRYRKYLKDISALDGLKHGTVTVILNHMPVENNNYQLTAIIRTAADPMPYLLLPIWRRILHGETLRSTLVRTDPEVLWILSDVLRI